MLDIELDKEFCPSQF